MKICPQCRTEYEQGQYCPKDGCGLEGVSHRELSAAVGSSEAVSVSRPAHASSAPSTSSAPGASGPSAEAHDEWIGKVIADRFRIVALVGQGGMGTVYEARHLYINKRVALKLLRPEITASSDAVERFQREAMAASTIGHQNIVRIDDFGRLPDGQVYLTMEYLEGEPLNRVLGNEVLGISEAVRIAIQVCDGLAAAHDQGIIHRDIKSDNVFLRDADRSVAILDFGIAKIGTAGQQRNLTQTGTIFGTPNYMSPEQALGKPVDLRTDVYSVGVVLYEMLTGVVPFESDSFMGVLARHLTEEPVAPSSRAPDRWIPSTLDMVVLRAMAKEPADRFSDMRDMAAALREAENTLGTPLANRAVVARPRRVSTGARASAGVRPGSNTETAGEVFRLPSVASWPDRGRGWVLGGTVAVVLSGLVLWAVFVRDGRHRGLASESERRDRIPAARSLARPILPTPATSRDAEASAEGSASDAVRTVRTVIASVPSGAQILRDGVRVGETPEVLTFAVGTAVTLQLVAPGYQDELVQVDGQTDQNFTVRLSPEAPVAPPAEPPSKALGTQRTGKVQRGIGAGKRRGASRLRKPPRPPVAPADPDDDPHDPPGHPSQDEPSVEPIQPLEPLEPSDPVVPDDDVPYGAPDDDASGAAPDDTPSGDASGAAPDDAPSGDASQEAPREVPPEVPEAGSN